MRGWLQGIWNWVTGGELQAGEDIWSIELTTPKTVAELGVFIRNMIPAHLIATQSPRFREWLQNQSVTIDFRPFAIFRD